MYFDRLDVCQAYYLWLQHHWSGQGCPHYARFCRLSEWFSPGPTFTSMSDLSDNGREIYYNIGQVA